VLKFQVKVAQQLPGIQSKWDKCSVLEDERNVSRHKRRIGGMIYNSMMFGIDTDSKQFSALFLKYESGILTF
jgi:hypothetical protein